jgi:hypothetical protein
MLKNNVQLNPFFQTKFVNINFFRLEQKVAFAWQGRGRDNFFVKETKNRLRLKLQMNERVKGGREEGKFHSKDFRLNGKSLCMIFDFNYK